MLNWRNGIAPHLATTSALPASIDGFPTASELAALRAWYQGLDTRDAVARYLDARLVADDSSRAIIRRIRERLCTVATSRSRPNLAQLLRHRGSERAKFSRAVFQAVEILQSTPPTIPQIGDAIERWLALRSVQALHAYGIRTLADLTVRVARRRMWWSKIPGLGATGARQIEAFFAHHQALTERVWRYHVAPGDRHLCHCNHAAIGQQHRTVNGGHLGQACSHYRQRYTNHT